MHITPFADDSPAKGDGLTVGGYCHIDVPAAYIIGKGEPPLLPRSKRNAEKAPGVRGSFLEDKQSRSIGHPHRPACGFRYFGFTPAEKIGHEYLNTAHKRNPASVRRP